MVQPVEFQKNDSLVLENLTTVCENKNNNKNNQQNQNKPL
jgi:5-methylcytosine-specific restriction endonuclease McrA